MSFCEAIVTAQTQAEVVAGVRCWDGVYDVRRTSGVWSCSCGCGPACDHVRAVERELAL